MVALGLGAQAYHLTDQSPSANFYNVNWEKDLKAYLKADAADAGPHLSFDVNASSADYYKVAPDLQSGLQTTLNSFQGQARPTFTFDLGSKLAQDYWLNLSRQVEGILYISITPSQTTSHSLESGEVRFEIWSGTQRVAGTAYTYTVGSAIQGHDVWSQIVLDVPSEAVKLAKGGALSVKIVRVSGLADLLIGTSGEHASYVDFHYYDFDPTAGLLYLENGLLISANTGSSLTRASASAPVVPQQFLDAARDYAEKAKDAAGTGPVFLVPGTPPHHHHPLASAATPTGAAGLAAISLRRRGARASWAAIVMASLAFAGCSATHSNPLLVKEPTNTTPTSSLDSHFGNDVGGDNASLGSIDGWVRDNNRVPLAVKGAHMSLLKTRHFEITDSQGHYHFPNVTAGVYTLSLNADGFDSLVQSVEVRAGQTNHLNITLAKPLGPSNKQQHRHGDWKDGETKREIYSDAFQPVPVPQDNLVFNNDGIIVNGEWTCPAGGGPRLGKGATQANKAGAHDCVAAIPVPADRLIQPGTHVVNITLNWDQGNGQPNELGLGIATGSNAQYAGNRYSGGDGDPFVARGRNEPFSIAIFPNSADLGHERTSRWQFYVRTPYFEPYHPAAQPVTMPTGLSAKITIFKGTVPFEPAHEDRWGANMTLPAIVPWSHACFQVSMTATDSSGGHVPDAVGKYPDPNCYFHLRSVLPGTKEIRGYLAWDSSLPGATWRVAYKPTNLTSRDGRFLTLDADIVSETAGNMSFKVDVKPDMWDWFYSDSPGWSIFPTDHDDDVTRLSGYYPTKPADMERHNFVTGITFSAGAVMIKDPKWDDV